MRIAVFILIVIFCHGCSRQQGLPSADEPGAEYGELVGLKETPNKSLRDELARIVEERGTPKLLTRELPPNDDNVAAALVDLFPSGGLAAILSRSEKLFPTGQFKFSPIELECAVHFKKTYDQQRLAARKALDRPECDFGILHTAGFLAELPFIDVVRICARLEAFVAAEALSEDKPAEALEPFEYMMRLAACLAAEQRVACRMEAAFLREEALGLLQAIVDHPKVTREDVDRLCQIVEEQLKTWPKDADVWIGDRAMGMHAYEVVRDGKILILLTNEELEEFDKQGILDQLPKKAKQGIDKDELYYLETMRKVISSCNEPYYRRADLFKEIHKELQQKLDSAEFPIVAGRMLLADIEKGHAVQARDRARSEAWALALATASGRKPPVYATNPLTGKKYRVVEQDNRIAVWNVGPDRQGENRPIVVPDLRKKN